MPCSGIAPCTTRSESPACSRRLLTCTTAGTSCQVQQTPCKADGDALRRQRSASQSCPDAQKRPCLSTATQSTRNTLQSLRQTENMSTGHWHHTSRRTLARPDAAPRHPSHPDSCTLIQSTNCVAPRCSSKTRCPTTADPRIPGTSPAHRTRQLPYWPKRHCRPCPTPLGRTPTKDWAGATHSPSALSQPAAWVSRRQNSSPSPQAQTSIRRDGIAIPHHSCSKIHDSGRNPCYPTVGNRRTLPPSARTE
mmetsp:Transcript_14536/g.36825  ORF Transcript_14536/g.36825 Transcript_14536/m.36825 type:complete len:250 (-) Transcript_14536:1393-2142(-)